MPFERRSILLALLSATSVRSTLMRTPTKSERSTPTEQFKQSPEATDTSCGLCEHVALLQVIRRSLVR